MLRFFLFFFSYLFTLYYTIGIHTRVVVVLIKPTIFIFKVFVSRIPSIHFFSISYLLSLLILLFLLLALSQLQGQVDVDLVL